MDRPIQQSHQQRSAGKEGQAEQVRPVSTSSSVPTVSSLFHSLSTPAMHRIFYRPAKTEYDKSLHPSGFHFLSCVSPCGRLRFSYHSFICVIIFRRSLTTLPMLTTVLALKRSSTTKSFRLLRFLSSMSNPTCGMVSTRARFTLRRIPRDRVFRFLRLFILCLFKVESPSCGKSVTVRAQ